MGRVDWFSFIDAELGQMTADRVRQHRSLTDEGVDSLPRRCRV